MGVTNNIKEILQEEELKKRTCSLCFFPITKENCWLLFRTNHATDWKDFKERESRGWISIEIELEHRECPENINEI